MPYLKLQNMLVIFLNCSSITFKQPKFQFKLSLRTFKLKQRVSRNQYSD